MEEAATRLSAILARAELLTMDLSELPASHKLLSRAPSSPPLGHSSLLYFVAGLVTVTVAVGYGLQLHTHAGLARALLKWRGSDIYREQCTVNLPDRLVNWVRPAEDCAMCVGITQVDRVSDILPEEFETKYAYTGRPVVVVDGALSWPGSHILTFQFFKDLYNGSLEQVACQFFPYETEFRSLHEVFQMSDDRAQMHDGTKPWYIGWSNCDNHVARVLKEQYSRPYFLPETSENKKTDWIFMGSPGYGAKMHVDSVSHPSWQAQVRGMKQWTLQPPPECIYQCNTLQVIVHPGEIIVLDTNRWYHQTLILQGEMSLTIGAEYD